MRTALAILFAALLALPGCGKKKADPPPIMHTAESVPMVEPPPAAPLEDCDPMQSDISDAHKHTQAAQADVQKVMSAAARVPSTAVQEAAKPLTSADSHLTTANADLADAKRQIACLRAAIDKHAQTAEAREKAFQANTEALREASQRDAKTADQALKAISGQRDDLKKKVAELSDEVMRAARMRLLTIGLILTLAGMAGGILAFTLPLPGGKWVAIVATPLGLCAIALAQLLPVIILSIEIAAAVAVLVTLVWLGWHLYKTRPGGPIECSGLCQSSQFAPVANSTPAPSSPTP